MTAVAEGHIVFVWEEHAPLTWPGHYTGACVKVADGKATSSAQGFSWSSNYGAWVARFGHDKVGAWAVAYPQDGVELGAVLFAHAPNAPYVVLDVEDFGGATWSDQQIRDVVAGVRRHLPAAKVGYSTYPTRAQAIEHHVNQQLLDELCDFAVPQVYYPYQRAELATVAAEHKHPHAAVAPQDDPEWTVTAKWSLKLSGAVFYWRCALPGWTSWPAAAGQVATEPPPVDPAPDPLKPVHSGGWDGRPFIAWDGNGWHYTDGLFRRDLGETQAGGLHAWGVAVRYWPHVQAETALVRTG